MCIRDSDGAVDMASTLAVADAVTVTKALSSDTQTTPETILTLSATYASTGSDGGAGSGSRIEFKIPDDETNPITGAAIAGIKEAADDSDASAGMAFYVSQNDTTLDEVVRIDHDGKVGIAETAPLGNLHVKSGDSGVSSADITDLVVECSGSGGISLLGGTGGQVEIAFGDSDDANIGRFAYNHASNYLATVVNGSEAVSYTHLTLPTTPYV